MVELIYNFIYITLMGEPTFEGSTTLAILLTYTIIVCFVAILIKLVLWAFNIPFKWARRRN